MESRTRRAEPPPIAKLLYTPEEAAETLAIGRTRVYELLASGRLESVRVGKSRRVPLGALLEFVEVLRAAGSSAGAGTAGGGSSGCVGYPRDRSGGIG